MDSGKRHSVHRKTHPPIRDLSDFCLRWPELRPQIEKYLAGPGGNVVGRSADEQTEIVRWLCLLADRVCLEPHS